MLIYEDTVEEIVSKVLCQYVSDKVAVTFTHHQIDTHIYVPCECGYVIVDRLH